MKETNRNAASLWWARRLAIGCTSASLAIVVAWVALPWLPMPRGLEDPVDSMPSTQVVDRLGAPLRTVAGANGTISCTLTESDVPRGIVMATLAAEDARFRSHPGFDARAIVRAAWQRARQGRVVSGASTITQQLVKLGDPRPRTLWNKAREAVLAARLERTWDKERILRSYLARINYGGRCAGLSEASRTYFGKPPAALDLAESAFLAAIPQAPARLGPWLHPERTKARQAWILGRCHRLGWIDDDELARALAEPIRLMPPGREFHAPHFVDQALAFRRPGFPAGRVPTTLDLSLQSRCEAIVRSHLAALRPMHVGESAVVVLENTLGGVLALVGSPDWRAPISGQVDGTRARRSPGSALKPFAYLLAIEDGATAADVLPDIPTRFATSTGLFEPLNYDRRFRGPVTLRTALANSLNVPAVRILADHGGPSRLLDLLAAMGVAKPSRPVEEIGLGLVLGGADVSLLELTGAYATLARLGVWIPTRLEPGPSPHGKRVASEDACWLLADILADPGARAECFGLETPLRAGFRFACKTGTSTGYRDNWALGFTPEFTVGVWTGNFDGSPMNGVSGVSGSMGKSSVFMQGDQAPRAASKAANPERMPAGSRSRDVPTSAA